MHNMEPGIIRKLDETVINRIAAGEIIQRPANALKEMIENSLDANSSNIQIVTKAGGLKFLQIQDNGTGIRKEDFGIVCERFTTSKLEKFEDLSAMTTYGFRGEALASISYVAHLTILSKTASEKCAYRATYENSKLKETPKLCAGNQGTQITVEDLFYNVPQRKQALKGIGEEFQRIYDVVCKYAIHNANVGFVLKKFGENNSIKTAPFSSQTDNIRIIYGNAVAKELISINMKDDVLMFQMKALITNVNYSIKKSIYLFFINHRMIESTAIKKCIDEAYSSYIPKGNHPFVYLSIDIDPSIIDVNVHPTKHEVHFLHEEEIINKIKAEIEKNLIGGNESRTFYTQSRLPGASNPIENSDIGSGLEKTYAKDLVRTDSNLQKIEKFFGCSQPKVEDQNLNETSTTKSFNEQLITKQKKHTKLSSILELRKETEESMHKGLRKLLADLTFVGIINKSQALIQYQTKLYLSNTSLLIKELFYQMLLYGFENFDTIKLSEKLSIKELALIALESEDSGWTPEDGPREQLADRVLEILLQKSPIMKEYFNLEISKDGALETLPLLLDNYIPSLAYLPKYIIRLATEVDWDIEKDCFQNFCRETAIFYGHIPESIAENECNWITEFVLYPAIKQYLLIPKHFAWNNSLLQIANLPDLYKVFERC